MNEYTGRCIGIITDAHSLLVPTMACLKDMKNKGITEIYSLGDNVGVGPSPKKIMDLFDEYNVKSIAGNSEDYITLGIDPFKSYFTEEKEESYLWTLSNLNSYEIGIINLYPHFIDLCLGGKKIALCHFANDCRFDYTKNSTWAYQANYKNGIDAYKQFLYTNSDEQKRDMANKIKFLGENSEEVKGLISAINEPLFNGKKVTDYDSIFQGHVHFEMFEKGENTSFYTLRAVGMAYGNDPVDTASYVILKEKRNNQGVDVQKVLVKYNRKELENEILNSDGPMDTIKKFTNMR